MNRNSATEIQGNVTLSVDDRPLALRLPVGAALFTVRGTLWLTQEGDPEDVILTAGMRFDVSKRAPVLVSALQGGAIVHVAAPAEARASTAADIYDYARERARLLREAELGRLIDAALARVASWLARAHDAGAASDGGKSRSLIAPERPMRRVALPWFRRGIRAPQAAPGSCAVA